MRRCERMGRGVSLADNVSVVRLRAETTEIALNAIAEGPAINAVWGYEAP